MAFLDAARNIVWLRNVLIEMEIKQTCAPIHQNNVRAMELVREGPAKHISPRNHVDTRNNFVMDLAEARNRSRKDGGCSRPQLVG